MGTDPQANVLAWKQGTIRDICRSLGGDRGRLLDILREVHGTFGCVRAECVDLIASEIGVPRVEVEGVVSFYAFLSTRPKGLMAIRLCNDVIDRMAGVEHVAAAFTQELGIGFGQTTADGTISLDWVPCIGMCDQAPAALVNEVVFTDLSSDVARGIARHLKAQGDPQRLVRKLGNGNNAHDLVQSMVHNNIRQRGPVILDDSVRDGGLATALAVSPVEVVRIIKTARLRGRGGAGFPTGMKWEFVRAAPGGPKVMICNADEGEPGTFKDRVILTERPHLVIEGMTIAAYAIGASEGILYLRSEYAYLRKFLEHVIDERRAAGLLGKNVGGRSGFDFDVRIQMGAGAYVCGEETALISSCEGHRGEPKNRPPFPAQRGYMDRPTCVNNVETLCCVARILDKGAGWFAQMGSRGSTGTKLLSISGDCMSPGVYELPFGVTLAEVLKLAGASDAIAVQVGGPSGRLVSPADFGRVICFDDLSTGGAVMVFGPDRDVLDIVRQFMDFFVHESCGYCTPCRVGTVLLRERLSRILDGRGEPDDLAYLERLCHTIKTTSRCGLGQSAPNPVLCTLQSFRSEYEKRIGTPAGVLRPSFALRPSAQEVAS